jgi:hypothetical protein
MSTTTNITIAAGSTQKISLLNWASVHTVIFSNSTQYDIQWSGFGVQGVIDVPAGQQWKFESSVYNAGQVIVSAIDNLNVGGSGPISLSSFSSGEPVPQGTWPVTIPAQRVITPLAGSVVATNLVNTGNPVQDVINVSEQGSPGYNLYADNQGNFTVAEYYNSVLTTLFRVIADVAAGLGNTNVLIGDATRQSEVLGAFKVDKSSAFFGQMVATGATPGTPGIESLVPNTSIGFYVLPNPDGRTGFTGYYVQGNTTLEAGIGFQPFGHLSIGFDGSQVNDSATARPFKWLTGDIKNDGNINNGLVNLLGVINNGAGLGGTINNNSGGGIAATLNNGANGGGAATINNGAVGNPATIVNGASGIATASTLTQYGPNETQILAAGAVVLNGGVSGTATLYQSFRGNDKVVRVKLNNFRTSSSVQTIALPVAFTQTASVRATDTDSYSLLLSGAAQTMATITALPSTGGGNATVMNATNMGFYANGSVNSAFDTIRFNASWAAAHSGSIILEGV